MRARRPVWLVAMVLALLAAPGSALAESGRKAAPDPTPLWQAYPLGTQPLAKTGHARRVSVAEHTTPPASSTDTSVFGIAFPGIVAATVALFRPGDRRTARRPAPACPAAIRRGRRPGAAAGAPERSPPRQRGATAEGADTAPRARRCRGGGPGCGRRSLRPHRSAAGPAGRSLPAVCGRLRRCLAAGRPGSDGRRESGRALGDEGSRRLREADDRRGPAPRSAHESRPRQGRRRAHAQGARALAALVGRRSVGVGLPQGRGAPRQEDDDCHVGSMTDRSTEIAAGEAPSKSG
jgi:hypothetical protein